MAAKPGVSPAKLALYDELVATNPKVERKGAAMPYTSMNGNMFSFLTPEGKLALRLEEKQRKAFLKKYRTKLCEQHGRVMAEYVLVPDSLLKKTAELKKHFAASVAYAGQLKPKATKRVAKKAAKKTAGKKVVKKNPAARKRKR